MMVGEETIGSASRWNVDIKSPFSFGSANTQGMMMHVDDVAAHCVHACSGCKNCWRTCCMIMVKNIGLTAVKERSTPKGVCGGSGNECMDRQPAFLAESPLDIIENLSAAS